MSTNMKCQQESKVGRLLNKICIFSIFCIFLNSQYKTQEKMANNGWVKNNVIIDSDLESKMIKLRVLGIRNRIPAKTTQQNIEFAYAIVERLLSPQVDEETFFQVTGMSKKK